MLSLKTPTQVTKPKKKNNLLGEKKQNPDTKMSINNHQTKNQQETPQIIASCHSLCMLKTTTHYQIHKIKHYI